MSDRIIREKRGKPQARMSEVVLTFLWAIQGIRVSLTKRSSSLFNFSLLSLNDKSTKKADLHQALVITRRFYTSRKSFRRVVKGFQLFLNPLNVPGVLNQQLPIGHCSVGELQTQDTYSGHDITGISNFDLPSQCHDKQQREETATKETQKI